MTLRRRAYIASPLGFTESGRHYYEQVYLPTLATVIEPVDPWSLTSEAEILAAQTRHHQRELALTIGRRNVAAIRSADLVIALLDGQEPDSGTVAEVGFAAGLGKRCYGLRTDLREAGEAGVPVNLQVVTFVEDSGGAMVASLEDLIQRLTDDLHPPETQSI